MYVDVRRPTSERHPIELLRRPDVRSCGTGNILRLSMADVQAYVCVRIWMRIVSNRMVLPSMSVRAENEQTIHKCVGRVRLSVEWDVCNWPKLLLAFSFAADTVVLLWEKNPVAHNALTMSCTNSQRNLKREKHGKIIKIENCWKLYFRNDSEWATNRNLIKLQWMRQQQNSVLNFWWTTADHRRSRSFNFRWLSLFSIVYRLSNVHPPTSYILHHIGITIYAVHSMGRHTHTRNCSKFKMGTKKIENQQPRMDVTKSCWSVHAHGHPHRIQHWPLLLQNSCSSRVVSSRRCSCHVTCSHCDTFYRTTHREKKINLIFSRFCIDEFRVNERPTDEWQNNSLLRHNVDAATLRHHTDLYVFSQTESIICRRTHGI